MAKMKLMKMLLHNYPLAELHSSQLKRKIQPPELTWSWRLQAIRSTSFDTHLGAGSRALSCQAAAVSSVHETGSVARTSINGIGHLPAITPDFDLSESKNATPDAILGTLRTLGFGRTAIDSLGRLPAPSFFAQWEKIQLLLKEGVAPVQVTRMLTRSKFRFFTESPYTKFASVLQILETVDLKGHSAGKALARTSILEMSIELLKRKLHYIGGIGLKPEMLKLLLQRRSRILHLSVSCIQQRLTNLEGLGLDTKDIHRIIVKFPHIVTYNFDKTLSTKVQFLESLGLDKKLVRKILIRNPTVIGLSLEKNICRKVNLFQQLGLEKNSDKFICALSSLCCCRYETIQARFEWLLTRGFSSDEVIHLLGTFPMVFKVTEKALEERLNYLVDVLERDRKEVLSFPIFLTCSLEKRIIPRFNALKANGLHKADLSLGSVLAPSSETFERRIGHWKESGTRRNKSSKK